MSNDWIEHTGDTCPVDRDTVVEVRYKSGAQENGEARDFIWRNPRSRWFVSEYRIITPAKPPEPEMPEPDLIALRLECLRLAVNDHFYEAGDPDYEQVADRFLRYVLNGLEKEAGMSNGG